MMRGVTFAAESLVLPGPAGDLEVRLDLPEAGPGRDPAAPVAFAVVFNDAGMPALRFNFRGVGASAGTHDEGRGEVHDALAVVRHGRERWPRAQLWLAGFSFGAAVAVRASSEAQPAGLVAVAPAVDRIDIGAVTPTCPWLVLLGDADDVVVPARMLEWARGLQPQPAVQVMAGAGHYFHGRLPDLRDAVTAFLNQRPGET